MTLPKDYPGVCAPLALDSFEWSQRATNCLALAGITSLKQLAEADGKWLEAGKNVGVATLREWIRGCLSKCVMPKWVKEITMAIHPVAMDEAAMVRIAGPYSSDERWMLEMAIAQLGSVPWCVLAEGGGYVLCRSSLGFVAVEEEL